MVKSFYDSEIEARGIRKGMEKGLEKGLKIAAENMLKDGDSIDKIKRVTGLSEEVLNNIKKALEAKGEH